MSRHAVSQAAGHAAQARTRRAGGDQLCIVHVLSSLGMGGQERIALDLAIGQARLGHEVIVVSLARRPGGPLEAEFLANEIDVKFAPKRRRVDASVILRLGRLFRERAVDVVHTHNPQPLIYASTPARAAGCALVHTKHGVNPAGTRQLWARRAAALLADTFVAVSDHTASVVRQRRECPRERLRVVPNGIDVSRFRPDPAARADIRDELGIPASAHLVGTVGRLFVEKGHAFFLRAVAPLLSRDFHVAIVGDGPEAGALSELAKTLPVPESVHLLGARHDVPKVVAAFDTFALTSVREGLPLVVPEAMAVGLPAVVTAVGGLPRVVEHGRTGYLVEYGDERDLRRRLEQLAADPALAHRLGERGRQRALADFSVEGMLRHYMEIYRAALS